MGGFLGGGGQNTPAENAAGIQLRADLAALQPGATLVLADGVYIVATTAGAPLSMGASGATIQAAAGARPIITNNDGAPPAVNVQSGTTLRGLWFGGTKDVDDKPVVVASDCVLDGCTFFGYYEALVEGAGTRNHYTANRFVNCGTGNLNHSLYISNFNALPGEGARVSDCIFIGGEGYGLHLFHGPTNCDIRRNFFGDCKFCLVLDGSGHVAQDNVIWSSHGGLSVFLTATAVYEYRHNIKGPGANDIHNESSDQVIDNNAFVDCPTLGTNPQTWAATNNAAHVGQSQAAIDAAVVAIEASFAASAATIRADSTIESNFALLAGVVTTWAAQL